MRVLAVSSRHVAFRATSSAGHPFESPSLELQEPTRGAVEAAAAHLRTGEIVAFPTETVYGLGADARSSTAVAKIYAAKNRPSDNPLILHVASLTYLRQLCPELPDVYRVLIDRFWPGPLTILLPLDRVRSGISDLCTKSQSTFAVRMPEHPLALALLHTADMALAAPSANASTRPSPTTAAHVVHDLEGRIDMVLDGGACTVGVESTVVDGLHDPPLVLRPGGVTVEALRACGGPWADVQVYRPDVATAAEVPRTPGMKYKHYSPSHTKVVLVEHNAEHLPSKQLARSLGLDGERMAVARASGWHDLRDMENGGDFTVRELGKTSKEVASNIFSVLRELDGIVDIVFVEGVSEAGEGLAVMNRLRKAATVVLARGGHVA
ncbi:hypothetical protein PYCC9005_004998 [Savitreella phatthalungensis]